ncbi:MAG: WbqC family protein [Bacteroidales bacterium]|jgi:hypothetical protein|nr:WbqC family protein [Bacteroidales bacterium]
MILLSTAYLPPVEYLSAFARHEEVVIEQHENFIKQTYRNRCSIPTANGVLSLSIPVKKNGLHNCPVKEVEIDYSRSWQRTHWRAIEAAYNASPFFLYYRDYLETFFLQQTVSTLFDFNLQLLNVLLKLSGIKKEYSFTEKYMFSYNEDVHDFRQRIHPKNTQTNIHIPPYRQVFSGRTGFVANMSCIDLLFNEGKLAKDYLQQITLKADAF